VEVIELPEVFSYYTGEQVKDIKLVEVQIIPSENDKFKDTQVGPVQRKLVYGRWTQ
jgi:hypothetical protein